MADTTSVQRAMRSQIAPVGIDVITSLLKLRGDPYRVSFAWFHQ